MGLGVDLTVETSEYGTDNREWLGTALGTQSTRSITLDADAFLAVTEFADGFVPSGVPVVVDANGNATPVAAAGTVCDGHLYSGVKVRAGRKVGAALYEIGKVKVAKLPAGSVTTARAEHIIYL